MLKNLKSVLEQKRITIKALASVLDVSEKTIWNKINEETDITYPEAAKIAKEFFPEYRFEYLFASVGNCETQN